MPLWQPWKLHAAKPLAKTPSMRRILIIEDDPPTLRNLKDILERDHYHVDTATDGETGLLRARETRPDVIILDWLLPELNGDEVCAALREENTPAMILMLTIRSDDKYAVRGLQKGADDYVGKPYSDLVILERVRALLRRWDRNFAQPDALYFDDVAVDFLSCEARRADALVPMRRKEFDVLRYLAARPGKVVSRSELMDNVWEPGVNTTERVVDKIIATLRKKLERDPKRPVRLRKVSGKGYSLVKAPDIFVTIKSRKQCISDIQI
jgi:two-component system alkaline phosphatase synthesis response regulator PhoP/two-component system response regulator VicR